MSQSEPTLKACIFSWLYFQQKIYIPMAKEYQSEKSPIFDKREKKNKKKTPKN